MVVGSDTRTGQDGGGGSLPGCNCSDTLMLLHISPDHHGATVLSIPRDTMVPILGCAASDGPPGPQANPTAFERTKAAVQAAGPAVSRQTARPQTDPPAHPS